MDVRDVEPKSAVPLKLPVIRLLPSLNVVIAAGSSLAVPPACVTHR